MGYISEKSSLMYKSWAWLVYSNIFISLEALFIAVLTVLLSGFKMHAEPLIISFSTFFLIYNVDRYIGGEEDEENMPMRTSFVRKNGKYFFILSIAGYLSALYLSAAQGLLNFALVLIPILVSIMYSIFKLKKILFVKNIAVGVSWGIVPLLVGAYYGDIMRPEIIFLSAFFTVSFFRSSMIFDIKDIKGDLEEGVRTIPNQFGVTDTKLIAILTDLFMMISWLSLILIGLLEFAFLILLPFHIYIVAYVLSLNLDRGEFFYSVIIDGECIFLGLLALLASFVGWI